jgi:hypothetical protein
LPAFEPANLRFNILKLLKILDRARRENRPKVGPEFPVPKGWSTVDVFGDVSGDYAAEIDPTSRPFDLNRGVSLEIGRLGKASRLSLTPTPGGATVSPFGCPS